MSLPVNVVKQKVPAGENAGKEMYFGRVCAGARISFEKLCSKITHHCMVTHSDVSGVLKEILRCAASTLEDGNIVQLGRLGNLRLSAGSSGVEEEGDFSLRHMRKPRVVFSPGKKLCKMIEDVRFRKEQVKEVKKVIICTRPHYIP